MDTDGSLFVSVPSSDLADSYCNRVVRIGRILEEANAFSVTFIPDVLGEFNKSGFTTRESAIAYEQEILDAHLVDVLKSKNFNINN